MYGFDTEGNGFFVRSAPMCNSFSPPVPIIELRDSHQRLTTTKYEIILEALRPATFRNLASCNAQIVHFRRPRSQFSFQMIADLFGIPETTAWEIYERFEQAECEDSLS
jgi:hypothetical protein